MGSRVVACRLAEDLYEEFETLCGQEGLSPSEKLKRLVDDFVYPPGMATGIAQPKESEPETVQERLAAYRCPECGGYLMPKYYMIGGKLELTGYGCPVCLQRTGYFKRLKVDSTKDGRYGCYMPDGSFDEYDTSLLGIEDDDLQKYHDDGGLLK